MTVACLLPPSFLIHTAKQRRFSNLLLTPTIAPVSKKRKKILGKFFSHFHSCENDSYNAFLQKRCPPNENLECRTSAPNGYQHPGARTTVHHPNQFVDLFCRLRRAFLIILHIQGDYVTGSLPPSQTRKKQVVYLAQLTSHVH